MTNDACRRHPRTHPSPPGEHRTYVRAAGAFLASADAGGRVEMHPGWTLVHGDLTSIGDPGAPVIRVGRECIIEGVVPRDELRSWRSDGAVAKVTVGGPVDLEKEDRY